MSTKISPVEAEKLTSMMPMTWPQCPSTSSLLTPARARSKARPCGWGPKIPIDALQAYQRAVDLHHGAPPRLVSGALA